MKFKDTEYRTSRFLMARYDKLRKAEDHLLGMYPSIYRDSAHIEMIAGFFCVIGLTEVQEFAS